MKIIISESQYNSLFESNYEKNKKLVEQMWDEGMSFSDIQELIGINKSQLYFLLKDKEHKINCSTAYHDILDIIENTDLINKKINVKDIIFLAKGEKHTTTNESGEEFRFIEFYTNPPHDDDWIEVK